MFKIVMFSCPTYVTFLISKLANADKDDLVKNIIIQNNELMLIGISLLKAKGWVYYNPSFPIYWWLCLLLN